MSAPGAWTATRLIARREILERVRSRSFQLGTVLIALVAAGAVVAPQLLPGPDEPEWTVAVTSDAPAGVADALAAIDRSDPARITVQQVDQDDPRELIDAGEADAVVLDAEHVVVDASADDRVAAVVTSALTQARLASRQGEGAAPALGAGGITVQEVGDGEGTGARQFVTFVGVFGLFIAIVTYGGWILNSVLEEKSNRVVEIIVSTIQPQHLLAGKVLGNGFAGLAQLVMVTVVAVVAAYASGNVPDLPGGIGPAVAAVIGWFLLGFALYAVGFAAAGSLVSRQADAQSVISPMISVVMAAYFLSIFVVNPDPGSTAARVLSILPPVAPLAMPVRIAVGSAALWEIALAVVLMVASIWGMIRLAGRVYMNALLRTGARVPLREALG